MVLTSSHAVADHVVDNPAHPGQPVADADLRGLEACYRMYDASDGWVFLAAPKDEDWKRLVGSLAPYVDLDADQRFRSGSDEAGN